MSEVGRPQNHSDAGQEEYQHLTFFAGRKKKNSAEFELHLQEDNNDI